MSHDRSDLPTDGDVAVIKCDATEEFDTDDTEARYLRKLRACLFDALEAMPEVQYVELQVDKGGKCKNEGKCKIIVELERDRDDRDRSECPSILLKLKVHMGSI
jgi:hypothetical protein